MKAIYMRLKTSNILVVLYMPGMSYRKVRWLKGNGITEHLQRGCSIMCLAAFCLHLFFGLHSLEAEAFFRCIQNENTEISNNRMLIFHKKQSINTYHRRRGSIAPGLCLGIDNAKKSPSGQGADNKQHCKISGESTLINNAWVLYGFVYVLLREMMVYEHIDVMNVVCD